LINNIQQPGKKKQGGLALLVLIIVLALTFTAYYFTSISVVEIQVDNVKKTRLALKQAKQADSEIAAGETHIEYLQQKIVETRQEFAAELRGLGLDISDEQLEFLLSTVVGDDVIAMSVAFDNVKVVTLQLEQLLVESGEDLTTEYGQWKIPRRYTGDNAARLAI